MGRGGHQAVAGHGRNSCSRGLVRLEDGLLKEHWDIIEDEISREAAISGLPMYGDTFPEER
jgi:hypothetical protein